MKVGDRIKYQGPTSRHDEEGWVHTDDSATVVEIHPSVPGTGRVLFTDDEEKPVIDNGLEGYAVIQFDNEARRAIPLERRTQ